MKNLMKFPFKYEKDELYTPQPTYQRWEDETEVHFDLHPHTVIDHLYGEVGGLVAFPTISLKMTKCNDGTFCDMDIDLKHKWSLSFHGIEEFTNHLLAFKEDVQDEMEGNDNYDLINNPDVFEAWLNNCGFLPQEVEKYDGFYSVVITPELKKLPLYHIKNSSTHRSFVRTNDIDKWIEKNASENKNHLIVEKIK